MKTPAINALRKPLSSMLGTKKSANNIVQVLTTKVNNPKVIILSGKVKISKIGLIIIFTRSKTKPNKSIEASLCISMVSITIESTYSTATYDMYLKANLDILIPPIEWCLCYLIFIITSASGVLIVARSKGSRVSEQINS